MRLRKAMLNKWVDWIQKTGENAYSEPEYADPESIHVYYEGKRHLVRNKSGAQVTSESMIITDADIADEDMIEIDGREWPVITVSSFYVRSRLHHKEVFL